MRGKIYASDEGFGHLVRQSAIVDAMRDLKPEVSFEVQTDRHAHAIHSLMGDVLVTRKFNNIEWAKQKDGTPDIPKIQSFFSRHQERTEDYIVSERAELNADFVISDFVYEAFHVARSKKIPCFGVAHFTWDWFFSKLFPPPLNEQTLHWFFHCAEEANVLYFPPFTPMDILQHYRKKVVQVPLIVRPRQALSNVNITQKFKVLIMDSGSNLLFQHMSKAVSQLAAIPDMHFFISSNYDVRADNVTLLHTSAIFSDYIPHMNLVISRAGFNTISEAIAYRIPLLLVGEAVNPEMNENMLNIKKSQMGTMVSLEDFAGKLESFLPRFIENEYQNILHAMENHEIPSNGATVVAEDILNRLEEV